MTMRQRAPYPTRPGAAARARSASPTRLESGCQVIRCGGCAAAPCCLLRALATAVPLAVRGALALRARVHAAVASSLTALRCWCGCFTLAKVHHARLSSSALNGRGMLQRTGPAAQRAVQQAVRVEVPCGPRGCARQARVSPVAAPGANRAREQQVRSDLFRPLRLCLNDTMGLA